VLNYSDYSMRDTISRDRTEREQPNFKTAALNRSATLPKDMLARDPGELDDSEEPAPLTLRVCAASSKARCCRGSRTGRRNWPTGL
jgi:hypothetical protein